MRCILSCGLTALLCCPLLLSAVPLFSQHSPSDGKAPTDVRLLQIYNCFTGPQANPKQFSQQLKQHNYQNWQGFIGLNSRRNDDDIRTSVQCDVLHYEVDGTQVEAVLMYPKQDAPLPVILYNRGGNRALSAMDFHGLSSLLNFVRQGYMVVASNYRGTDSWPLYKSDGSVEQADQPIGKDEYGGKDVDDVVALLPLLRHYPQADSSRIALYGVSRGGMMAFQVAARLPQVKALIVKSGVYDLAAQLLPRPKMAILFQQLIPGYSSGSQPVLDQRSALYVVNRIRADLPILLLHGDADDRVEVQQALQMADVLKQQHRPHKLVVYPGGDHYLRPFAKQLNKEVSAWLTRYL